MKAKRAEKAAEKAQMRPEEEGGPTPAVIAKLEAKGLSAEGTKKQCMQRLIEAPTLLS